MIEAVENSQSMEVKSLEDEKDGWNHARRPFTMTGVSVKLDP
jgi:hypothetical protein